MILSSAIRAGLSRMNEKITSNILFGPYTIHSGQIFVLRKNAFAIVNLKPFSPGHVLVCSRRCVPKMQDLTEIEAVDLFMTAQEVAKMLQTVYKVENCELVCQNGPEAGQTVKHTHFHIRPHMANTSEIQRDDDAEREPRNLEDMIKQAELYRPYFQQNSS